MGDAGEETEFRFFHALVLHGLTETCSCLAALMENGIDVVSNGSSQCKINECHPPRSIPRCRHADGDCALGILVGLIFEVSSHLEVVGARRK